MISPDAMESLSILKALILALVIVALGLFAFIKGELGSSGPDFKVGIFSVLMTFWLLLAGTLAVFSFNEATVGAPVESTGAVAVDSAAGAAVDTAGGAPATAAGGTPVDATSLILPVIEVSQRAVLTAQVILVAMLSLIVPAILGLWNSFSVHYLSEIRLLGQTPLAAAGADAGALLVDAKNEYAAIHRFGGMLQIPFYTIVCILVLVTFLTSILGAMSVAQLENDYSWVGFVYWGSHVSKYFAEISVLLFLFFLVAHMILVQRSLTHLHARIARLL